MKNMNVGHEKGYAAVLLLGPTSAIETVARTLEVIGERVVESTSTTILLQDVRENRLPDIVKLADAHKMTVSPYGERTFLVQVQKEVKKAFKLNLQPGKWYFADNIEEDFPFVLIRDARIEKVNDDTGRGKIGTNDLDEIQMIDLEFHSANGDLPIREVMSSSEAAKFGLRPATEDDFSTYDMIPPSPESLVFIEASVGCCAPRFDALSEFSR